MRLLLDACILYPTVLREILIGLAEHDLYTPLWSPRILEEWAHTAARTGVEATARAEIALMRDRWRGAEVTPDPDLAATLSLPDPGDIHVLAAAITGKADAILTANLRDFPGRTLARHDLMARHPDGLILELLGDSDRDVRAVIATVHARTEAISGQAHPLRPLLKRAGLPRTARALESTPARSR